MLPTDVVRSGGAGLAWRGEAALSGHCEGPSNGRQSVLLEHRVSPVLQGALLKCEKMRVPDQRLLEATDE